jgi:ribonuclease D
MVTSSEQLDVVAETIRTEGAFAYDTEFIGESTYIPELCLIQASTRSTLWLIDPFQLESLDPVWSLIADPEVTTIVHAGAQDLEPVERHIGRVPAKVVDTQVAAGFMGLPYPVSLARLVFEMTGWTVPKGMTFTDWSKRPLSSMQLRYAADDVRYLPLIWDRMQEQLNSFGHLDLAFEECASACKPGAFLPDIAKQCRKIHRKNPMRSGQWSRLHHLMSLRDECAREANLPPRTLIPDGCISDLARRNPTTIEALRQLKGMPRPTVERHGKSILQRLAREDDEHIPDRPEKLPDETAVVRVQIDAIWSAISCWCLSNSIAPALVGTRNCIAEWIGTGGLDDHGHGPWSYGWRREIAGDFLLRFLRSECTLPMQWEDGRLVQQDDPN